MSNVTEVIKTITLDLSDIPKTQHKKAKKEVGNYLVNEILRSVGNGKSPVEGEAFKKLTKEYAKKEHGGRRLPILELEGDMLAQLKAKNTTGAKDKIDVGITGKEAPKADGHNQLSGEAKRWAARTERQEYKRRFIPSEKQKFKSSIRNGIDDILSGFRVTPEEREGEEIKIEVQTATPSTALPEESPEAISITSTDLFSDEIIEELLAEALKLRDL